MCKKHKNISKPTDINNLTGSNKAEHTAGSAPGNTDSVTNRSYSSLTGGKTDVKTNRNYSSLSKRLYLLILIGLCIAVILLLAGFALNFFNGTKILSMDKLQDNALNPGGIADAIKNSSMPASQYISYAGLITMVLVPAAGLIYIIVYFACRKRYNLALTAAGVLLILALSAIIGLLKS